MKHFLIISLLFVTVNATLMQHKHVDQDVPIAGFRPPAVPLIVMSPSQSIWSMADHLTDGFPQHWAGATMGLMGAARIDGTVYRWMGPGDASGIQAPAMTQVSVQVLPLRTIYVFQQAGISLTVTFTTPSLLTLDTLSRPYTYITFDIYSMDNQQHQVQLYFDTTAEPIVNDAGELITWKRETLPSGMTVLSTGTYDQEYFGVSGDGVRNNWGYIYLAADASVTSTVAPASTSRSAFTSGSTPPSFDNNQPRSCSDTWPVMSLVWSQLPLITSNVTSVFFMYAYDDVWTMKYFNEYQAPYWHTQWVDMNSLLSDVGTQDAYQKMMTRVIAEDQSILTATNNIAGPYYATITALGYRQTTGAMAVTSSPSRGVWVWMKEISSDGDVSTVDVIYPASPLLIWKSPEITRKLLLPLLAYALNTTSISYNLPWAPHHLGEWPVCNIAPQQQEQMPMEETANLLVIIASLIQREGVHSDWLPYMSLLKQWAMYLNTTLPDPGNQLCTDDFEGPSPHNVNLAAKGIVGLGAWAIIQKANGDVNGAIATTKQAQEYVTWWTQHAADGNSSSPHTRLQYDLQGTWSLKYNLLFDSVLQLNLFKGVLSNDIQWYMAFHHNNYGVPLDNRANFTKTDWLSWIAAMADSNTASMLYKDIYMFAHNTAQRIPFCDWYDTTNANAVGFKARPVIGGLYAKMIV